MKRTVQKITPAKDSSFDQQFWPVLVALTVLSGIMLGAVLTVLRGPWMWGSLLVLPLLAAVAIFMLFHLDNSRLRRSLQFAIISSLAIHLFILVFASVVNIFQNPFKPAEREIAQQRVRTIEISDQQAAFVFQQTNAQETPEPRVETEKNSRPTTNTQPQTIPVPEVKSQINPQLVRRETTATSVPRQNRDLSKLRRQHNDALPQSSQKMTGEKVGTVKPAPAAAKPKIDSSTKADTVKKQVATQPANQPKPEKPSPAPAIQPKTKVAQSSSSSPRRRETSNAATSKTTASASPSKARVRRDTSSLPIAAKKAPDANKIANATTTKPSQLEPSAASSKLTRRPVKSNTVRPAMSNQPRTQSSPQSQIARSQPRTKPNQIKPSISNQTSQTKTPRRSTQQAAIAASPVAIEKPSRSPESKTATRELNSKTLSVSRSTEGVAGVGRSKNLDRFVGGKNSPATRASDSARRQRTTSRPSETRMLTSSQNSQSRRSVGSTKVPTSAFKAETTAAAKISGANITGQRTLESSAAKIETASTTHRDESSAEKGSATVDLGPTKVVFDRENRRRSGGGQTQVSRLNPEATRRSKDRSEITPSLMASTEMEVAAPSTRSSAPPVNDAIEPSTQSLAATRAGGDMATTAERWSSETAGEISDQGKSTTVQQLADSRVRSRRMEDAASWNEEDEEDEEINGVGNRRTRVASAPVVRSTDGFGKVKNDGRALTSKTGGADALSESTTVDISRQAAAALPGSGIGRTAANVLMQAATSLPIIESAPTRREGRSTTPETTPELTRGVASSPRRRSTTKTPTLNPSNSGENMEAVMTASSGNRADTAALDSKSLSLSRTKIAAMEQVQGSQLEVIAPEGPAGLGERPDNFIGVMTRPATRESKQIQPNLKNRYRDPDFGGLPSINPDAVLAKDAFKNRRPSAVARAAEPTTEAAIHLGLEFLARYQAADGSWTLTGFDRESTQHISQLDSDTAATGMALLAFQGAGYNHREFKYARQIDHAIQWLIENQSDDGGLYVQSDNKSDNACRLYSHGIAALALTEAYGMTQDTRLKEPAQKALDYIIATQDPRKGGWRYFDEPGKKSADTSVSGWMMMALQSGRLAGLKVDDGVFDGVADWLDVAADPENESLYRYNPYARDSKGVSRIQGRKPTPSMTAVGLLMRIYSGWDQQDPRLIAGAEYLLETQLPNDSTPIQRDTYYWYYATQVMKYVDGPQWNKWNNKLRPLLLRSQEKSGDLAGSWHPYQPVPDRWGAFGGRIYVTAMNLLSLEVRHRMLPLYRQNTQPVIKGVIENDSDIVSTKANPVTSTPNVEPEPETQPEPAAVKPEPKSRPKPMVQPNPKVQPKPQPRTQPQPKVARAQPKARTPKPKTNRIPKSNPTAGNTKANTPSTGEKKAPPMVVGEVEKAKPTTPKAPIAQPPVAKPKTAPAKPVVKKKPPSEFGSIAGVVTLDGKPLRNAKVEFIPTDKKGQRVSVKTNSDGRYIISKNTETDGVKSAGIKAGKYKVSITTYSESPDENVIDFLEEVPAKYNLKTELTVTVTREINNAYDIQLDTN